MTDDDIAAAVRSNVDHIMRHERMISAMVDAELEPIRGNGQWPIICIASSYDAPPMQINKLPPLL